MSVLVLHETDVKELDGPGRRLPKAIPPGRK
jgi:hypothetical protein